jgi:hypothetical protein
MTTKILEATGRPKFSGTTGIVRLSITSNDDVFTATATDVDGSALARTFTKLRYAIEWLTDNFRISKRLSGPNDPLAMSEMDLQILDHMIDNATNPERTDDAKSDDEKSERISR